MPSLIAANARSGVDLIECWSPRGTERYAPNRLSFAWNRRRWCYPNEAALQKGSSAHRIASPVDIGGINEVLRQH